MYLPKTAQLIKYGGLFLFLLVIFPFDLAATLTISLYLAVNSKDYIKLLIVSAVLFIADIVLKQFDINIRFISDMLLDSYILLLTAAFIYSKSQPQVNEYFKKLGESSQKVFSRNILKMIGISTIFSLLLAPIVGISFAVVIGYLSFSYLSKHFEGKYAFITGLFFLLFSPFFIIAARDDLAESFAVISFFFLIIGTLQEILEIVRKKKIIVDLKPIIGNKLMKADLTLPKISFPKLNYRIFLAIVILLSYFIGFYFSDKFIKNINFPVAKLPESNSRPATPTSPSSSQSATLQVLPTQILAVTSESAKLKILVQNGTETAGLAASTAAILQKVGFDTVKIGNAERSDYGNWELSYKEKADNLSLLLKNILELKDLKSSEASVPAGFDVLIIAGKNK